MSNIEIFEVPTRLLAPLAYAALVFGIVIRFLVLHNQPLGIDEGWTGAIVGQAAFRATIHESLLDANAPAYFFLMHFWSNWFGLSNTALRLPSIVFGAIAPLIALIPARSVDRTTRLVWCGLVALWIPGIYYSEEARCYSLVLLLATACTLAFVQLLTQPSIHSASTWALLGSLAVLTQYHSLILIGCQGIGYLVIHRTRALRTWPAALLFLPAFIWLAIHIPRLLEYADQNVAWHPLVTFDGVFLGWISLFLFGNQALGFALTILILILAGLTWRAAPVPQSDSAVATDFYCWIAIGAALAGAIIVIAIGSVRPSFTPRYLMVFMPGILLGLANITARFSGRWTLAPVGILLLYSIFAANWGLHTRTAPDKWNIENASRELANYKIDQLVFLFDTRVSQVSERSTVKALGEFFFKRQGLAIPVVPVILHPGDDANDRLIANATTPRSGILWLHDAAVTFHPRIEQINSDWVCTSNTSFEKGVGVVACHRRATE